MSVDHLPDPLRLAGQIAVVRTVFDAGGDQLTAILRVRADSRQHNAGVASYSPESVAVMAVGNQD